MNLYSIWTNITNLSDDNVRHDKWQEVKLQTFETHSCFKEHIILVPKTKLNVEKYCTKLNCNYGCNTSKGLILSHMLGLPWYILPHRAIFLQSECPT